jgi:hypothetical protein
MLAWLAVAAILLSAFALFEIFGYALVSYSRWWKKKIAA